MATTYYNDIQKLYVAYFNRPADPAGLAFWEGVVEGANGDTAAVSAAFAGSAEYKAAYANMTNAQIVDAVYQNLFSRPAEDAGKAYWADLLDKNTITIDQVVTAVASGAQSTDLTAYNNKVAASAAFTAAVDTDAEKAGYSGDAANKVAKSFLAGITTDATLANALIPANLNATVGNVVASGTAFSVASALANLSAATKAEAAFLVTADGDNDATTSADHASVDAALTTKTDALVTALGSNGATYAAGSPSVQTAIVNDQVVANANALSAAQSQVAAAQTKINAVAGLSAAISSLTAAKTAAAAADKAELNATADLAAKVAAFNTLNASITVVVADNGTASYTNDSGAHDLIVKDSSTGALKLASGVTETTNPGITALLASSVAKEGADTAQSNAHDAQTAAQLNVNHLDVSPDGTEASTLAAVTTLINTYKDVTVASGAQATEAQIATEMSILTAKANAEADAGGTAHTNLATFTAAVNDYHTAAEANPLVDALTAANGAVTTASDNITAFTKAVNELNTAKANSAQLAGYDAAIQAANDLFTSHNYNLVPSAAVTGTVVATDKSDVFVVGSTDATISLFNLQGHDVLSIGTGYTLNTTGSLTKGNDAVLEAFVLSANGGADTQIVLETKAFSSNSTDPEVTITLTGVKAADVHLDSNGIITVG